MAQTKNKRQLISATLVPALMLGLLWSSLMTAPVQASGISNAEVIQLANAAREKEGLAPLSENAALSKAASDKAHDMIANDYFAHTSPAGVTPWHWIKKEGYVYKGAGENLAVNFSSAKEQHSAWMKSESHRANILNSSYREIGVAVVEGKLNGETSLITVEFFGTPLVAVADGTKATTPLATPAPVKTPEIKGLETEVKALAPASSRPVLVSDTTAFLADASLFSPQMSEAGRALPPHQTVWIWLLSAIFINMAIVLAPIVFLSEAYFSIVIAVRDRQNKGKGASQKEKSGKNKTSRLLDGVSLKPAS
ncbi:MAG: CAP domain-containing protein [Candidatus Moraniibacteriota bacterium]